MFARATLLVLVLIGACTQNPGSQAGQIGPEGGSVKSADGRATLGVPKDAVTSSTLFTLSPSNQANKPPAGKVLVPGSLYALNASKNLVKPATLSLQYDPAQVVALSQKWGVSISAAASTLELVRLVDNNWQATTSTTDEATQKVSGAVSESGVYALLAPDGSRPNWKLEVRSSTLNLSNEIKASAPVLNLLNRTYVYEAPSRNGEKTPQALALTLAGPDNFSASRVFPAGRRWDVSTIGSTKPGKYQLKTFADGQEIETEFEVKSSPTLAIPIINSATASGSTVSISWEPVPDAKSYAVYIYDSVLSVAARKVVTAPSASLEVNFAPYMSYAAFVLAYNWDDTRDRTQPYSDIPDQLMVSAAFRVLGSGPNPPLPPPPPSQAKLVNLGPNPLTLSGVVGKTTTATLKFANQGNSTLEYTASISGSGFSISQGSSGTVSPYSGEAQVVVQGTCSNSGIFNATLTLTTNDPDKASVAVPVSLECIKGLTSSLVFSRYTHASSAGPMRWSPDGNKMATFAPNDGRIYIWNSAGKVVQTLSIIASSGDTSLQALAWSPDSQKLAAGNGGRLLKVWQVDTGTEVLALDGLDAYRLIAWNPGGTKLAAANFSGAIAIYDASSGALEREIYPPQAGNFSDLKWSSDGSKVVLATNTNVRRWNVSDGSLINTVSFGGDSYSYNPASIALSVDGSKAAKTFVNTGSNDWSIEIRDTASGNVTKTFSGVNGGPGVLVFSPNSNLLALHYFGPPPGRIDVWDLNSSSLIKTFNLNTGMGQVYPVRPEWSGDSSQLLVSLYSGLVQGLSLSSGEPSLMLGYHTGSVSSLSFADGKLFSASSSRSYGDNNTFGSIAWADPIANQTLKHIFPSGNNVASVKWLGNNKIAAVLQSSSTFLRTYDTQSGTQLSSVTVPIPANNSYYYNQIPMRWSPDGSKLVYWTGNSAGVVDTASGQHQSLSEVAVGGQYSSAYFNHFAFSGDGSKLYGYLGSGSASGNLIGVWNPSTGSRESTVTVAASPNSFYTCNVLSWNADASKLACAYGSTMFIIDSANGQIIHKWTAPNQISSSLVWSPDGKYLLSGLDIYSQAGSLLHSIPSTLAPNTGCCGNSNPPVFAWSSDGQYVAAGDSSGSVFVWKVSEGS